MAEVASTEGAERRPASGAQLLIDVTAGLIVAALPLAYAVSFSALFFSGDLASGFSVGLWSLICGTIAAAIFVGLFTSIPPIVPGVDPTTMAMFNIMILTVAGSIKVAGGPPSDAVLTVLMASTLTTLLIGLLFLGFGLAGWGSSLRFIPSGVIGGFLVATGVLLILAGLRLFAGRDLSPESLFAAVQGPEMPKALVGFGFLAGILLLRRFVKSPLLLPLAILGVSAAIDALLLSDQTAAYVRTWYLSSVGALTPWVPLLDVTNPAIHWSAIAKALPDILATAIVTLISLAVRSSAFEVMLARPADFDQECRAQGYASLATAFTGGMQCAAATGATKLLNDLGARTRVSTLAIGVVLALVPITGINLPHLIPVPVLAGLLLIIGYGLVIDGLMRPIGQRAWTDVALILAITAICLRYGFFTAVLAGFVASCLVFAINYSRIGVVRRHMTRQTFSGHVEHTVEVERQLRERGDAIHIYWLSGYVFFGSSDRVFEQIRADIEKQKAPPVQYLIIDLSGVPAADAAAAMSFTKLRNLCDGRGILMIYAGANESLRHLLTQAGCLGGRGGHRVIPDLPTALSWAEEQLLQRSNLERGAQDDFIRWLASEIGTNVAPETIASYLERRHLPAGSLVYKEGTPADSIDFVASGSIAVTVEGAVQRRGLRRMARRTLVGEMGFFRHQSRTATVLADEAVELYTLTRDGYQRMLDDHPKLATEFLTFIIRTLSDRLAFANSEIAALH